MVVKERVEERKRRWQPVQKTIHCFGWKLEGEAVGSIKKRFPPYFPFLFLLLFLFTLLQRAKKLIKDSVKFI